MLAALIEHYRAVIARAPGPAPWYLGLGGSDLSSPELKQTWERDPAAGPTELMDHKRRVYAIASINSYVQRISPKQFVAWYKSGTAEAGKVVFHLYEISSLRPMTEKDAPLARINRTPFASAAPALAECAIPRSQPFGLQSFQFPPAFVDCPELLVLVSNDKTWDDVGLNLWSLAPSRQQMTVTPQDWFTAGPYDFGYQWVTRIARSPDTGNLVGDGIRIGAFVLNDDGSKFLEWIGA